MATVSGGHYGYFVAKHGTYKHKLLGHNAMFNA